MKKILTRCICCGNMPVQINKKMYTRGKQVRILHRAATVWKSFLSPIARYTD